MLNAAHIFGFLPTEHHHRVTVTQHAYLIVTLIAFYNVYETD